ncbi:hypothetical protein LSUE1_G001526 [Lachnellula suecica]|uniref:Uncharacterized protein n=1 Tax=Lachnellula suecica TaxID=602035 RepID=A0A8T9CEZ0_9HELO|nr:hypothetical protein LSUE1_G001526 [Lachnellula suecica]
MHFVKRGFSIFGASANAYSLPVNCANNSGIMTTPTYGTTGAVFTVCAQDFINGSPSTVYNVILDFLRYPAWNEFVYYLDLPANVSSAADVYVGMPMTLHTSGLIPGLNTTSDERITYLEPDSNPPWIGWRYDPGAIGGLLMQAEHDLGNGSTKYVSWETYYGAGAAGLQLLLGNNLQADFELQGTNLKQRVESL